MTEERANPEATIDQLVRSLDHCTTKLMEIRTIVHQIEPGEIRTLLLAAADRLERESEDLRSSLGLHGGH